MDAATIEVLADLIVDLDRAGVQELVAEGDTLRYRPRSAVTPDLAERLRVHKAELVAALTPPTGPDRVTGGPAPDDPEPVPWEDCIEPEPCPTCGGLLCWWNALGDRRCLTCDPPLKAIKALERVERIRRRLGIPSPVGAAEMRGKLKRVVGTCRSANQVIESRHDEERTIQ